MGDAWVPGAAGPHESLVARIHAQIQEFTSRGAGQAAVEVELREGATLVLHSLSADPGYGFVTLRPHPEDAPAGSEPREAWIVPIGAIARITLKQAEAELETFGFALPDPDG